LRDAPLLLLDEATRHSMPRGDAGATALEELMRHRTTLVIAHRLATVLSCDRILVMDQARSSSRARNAELVAVGRAIRQLARLQFEGI